MSGILTHEDVAHERRRQTEHDNEHVRQGQVHDEEVGHGSHPRGPEDHRDDETVPDQPDDEHHKVGHTVHGRHRGRVPVEQLVLPVRTGVVQGRHFLVLWGKVEKKKQRKFRQTVLNLETSLQKGLHYKLRTAARALTTLAILLPLPQDLEVSVE